LERHVQLAGRCELWNSHSSSLYSLGTDRTENRFEQFFSMLAYAILTYLAVTTQRTIYSGLQPLYHSILTLLVRPHTSMRQDM
jgi:hypothetical protein